MDELMSLLEDITANVLQQIGNINYEDLIQFVEIRGQYMDQIKELNLSMDEINKYRERMMKLLSLDVEIVGRMQQFIDEAKEGIDRTSQARLQQRTYEGPYAEYSLFFDTKK